ncbi:hypothetical protein FCM35_KLT09784 [Carex littledalei]|uniref:Uncharacterized protein n=1 Tax=Carex littledalei TaxID=544730 RepID=A0A833R200_9POAL|nr:hypothetical protein FCM35_KLT09784 [Carex littledalei]
MFWTMNCQKNWHMGQLLVLSTATNASLSTAMRTTNSTYSNIFYAHLRYPYAFDRKYLEFTQELNETIKWGTTLSDVRAPAEQIWRKHISVPSLDGLGPFDIDMMLRDESNIEDFVPALKATITANGLESYPFNKDDVEDFLGDEEGYFNSLTTMNRCFKRYMEVSCCCTTAIVLIFNSNPIQCGAGEVST